MLAFFYKYMRPIIEEGKLYKVYSPLYKLDDKEHPYVANKTEMVDIYHEKIIKTYKVKCERDNSFMSKSELREFLMDTYDYSDNLIRAAKESGNINKYLVESIIAHLTLFDIVRSETDYNDISETFSKQNFIKSIMAKIQKKFKEITVDKDGKFSGVVEGKYSLVKVGNRFFKKTSDLIPVYQKYGYTLTVVEKGKEPKEMTIGEFLDSCTKLLPKILIRFKGLGELDGKQLRETTLDINNRISIQFTVDDVERELAIFELTHGNSKKDAAGRKELMKKYKIRREDLDN